MAKETKGTQLALTKNIDMSLDKNDIIAIKVSEVETDLLQQQTENDTQIKLTNKEIDTDTKTLEKNLEKKAMAAWEEKAKQVAEGLKLIGANVSSVLKFQFTMNDQGEPKASIDVGVREKGDSYRDASITKNHKIELVKADRKLVDRINANREHLAELRAYGVDLRKRLSQINTLERQVRARLARTTLELTGDKDILDEIGQVTGLPALPEPPKKSAN